MAKRGKLRVTIIFLAVLAVHTVSATGVPKLPKGYAVPPDVVKKIAASYAKFMEALPKMKEKVDNLSDIIDLFLEQYKKAQDDGTVLPVGSYYFQVTGIKVGERTLPTYNGEGGAIVGKNINLPFLTEEAYGLLENEFSGSRREPKHGLLCSKADQLQPVTLVFAANDYHLECLWYKNNAGSKCLAILPLP